MGDLGGGGDAGGDTGGDEAGGGGGLEGLFAGDMKNGKLMSEEDFAEIDSILEEDDEVNIDDVDRRGVNVTNNVTNKVNDNKKRKGKKYKRANRENQTGMNDLKNISLNSGHSETGFGAKDFKAPIMTAKDLSVDLNDSVMPQSPVISQFIDKQMSARMSKSLDSMGKTLNIQNKKGMLNEDLEDYGIFINEKDISEEEK
jgi:hypothetical protein